MATLRNIFTLLVALSIGISLSGCTVSLRGSSLAGASLSKVQGGVAPSGLDVLITRNNPSPPAGCSPLEVATLITGFFDAVNQGDTEQIPHYFNLPQDADPYPKAWYSISDTSLTHFVAYTEPELLTYFSERHAHGEVLQLYIAGGKGAIDCEQKQIFVWSMVMLGPDQPLPPNCPRPSDWKLGERIIACARN